jgi:hypothetical protein
MAVSLTVPALSAVAVFFRLPGRLRLFRRLGWLRWLRWLRLECRRHVSRPAVLRRVRRVMAMVFRAVSRRGVVVVRRRRRVRRVGLVQLGQLRGLVLTSERLSGRHVLLVSERQAPRRPERLCLRGCPGLDRRRDGRPGADARRRLRRRRRLRAGLGLLGRVAADATGRGVGARARRPSGNRCRCGRRRCCRRRRRGDTSSGGGRPRASGRRRHDDLRSRGRGPAGRAGRARRRVHRAGIEQHRHRCSAEQDCYRRGGHHAGPRNSRKCAPLARFLGRHRPPPSFLLLGGGI